MKLLSTLVLSLGLVFSAHAQTAAKPAAPAAAAPAAPAAEKKECTKEQVKAKDTKNCVVKKDDKKASDKK